MESHIGSLMSALLALVLAVLGLQWRDQRAMINKLSEKLDCKIDRYECKERRGNCTKGPAWDSFREHSHTGLPPESKVIC